MRLDLPAGEDYTERLRGSCMIIPGDPLAGTGKFSIDVHIELSHRSEPGNNLKESLHIVLVIIDNHQRKKGIGLLQRLYQPYFGMTIFCGSHNLLEYMDEGEFPKIMSPFNYIHVSQVEMANGRFFHYCLSKVEELNLRNVEGYFFAADDAIFNFWHKLDLSEILFPFAVLRNGWWPTSYG
ncbi:unnamed protein product [Cylicocyclus nassatus]|uniref:Uncharacterized protein n=1 Tax=Cylicocyclus nassatus TaxID=53992 RepID=A0AA36H9V1_CYLNA|nr:unnamed protein product [Cylicocyclus nassatus]